ncbi:hypothetical protein ABI59_23460 [Acidobacteria bacterium Mor1]|nr:hypothetical protein ABI59_23460 [Acidobacteria bacterium Mor1]
MNIRFFITAGLLLIPLLASCGSGPGSFDRDRLERDEDLAEALANDLLAMSVTVRDRDYETLGGYWAESVTMAAIPPAPEAKLKTKWVLERPWHLGTGTEALDRDEALKRLESLVGRFQSIEDARFKVKHSSFADSGHEGQAQIKFFLVARDEQGRREWVKGTAHIEVVRQSGEDAVWQIRHFVPDSLMSKVAAVDLFSEVAYPAGLDCVFPPFGVGRNQGFVSHGAAVADVNGDGLLDLAVTGVERNRLYLNAGDGTFTDVSRESLVGSAPIGSGALFLDHDNDGDQDLFLAAVGNQMLLENRLIPDGDLVFWDVSEEARVDKPAVGFSALASDVNLDGLTDIYVSSYNRYGTVMPDSWYQAENGTPNRLFINLGDGRFEEAAERLGVADARWSYSAGFVDYDDDGDQDLYVANDFGENAFYRNEGGRFTDVAGEAGVVDPGFGMGVAFGDYDNDGDLDLQVTNMSSTAGNRILSMLYPEEHEIRKTLGKQAAGNSLYRNDGDGSFTDVTRDIGGISGGWAFGGGFVDFDNDGWEDLYSPNGFISGKTMKDT